MNLHDFAVRSLPHWYDKAFIMPLCVCVCVYVYVYVCHCVCSSWVVMRTAKGEHNFAPQPHPGFASQESDFCIRFWVRPQKEVRGFKLCTAGLWESKERLHRKALKVFGKNTASLQFLFLDQAGLKQLIWHLEQLLTLFGPSGHILTFASP